MNYFPFHLGDYAAHTGHLEPLEDLAYRRLLDQYYLREGPLPDDINKLAKLVRMRTDAETVQSVLSEFFVLCPEGWRHKRCDEEIAGMQAKQAASEERDDHEKTRQQKHRERRAAMFAQLADVGVYPAWNAKTGELERLISENPGQPVTAPVTAPVTQPDTHGFANENRLNLDKPVTAHETDATTLPSPVTSPATAIPTPTPTPTPTPISKNTVVSPSAPPAEKISGTRLPSDWTLPDPWRMWCSENRTDLDPDDVAAQFRDFWRSKPGKDGRKADWAATWRNWCRSQKPPSSHRRGAVQGGDWTDRAI